MNSISGEIGVYSSIISGFGGSTFHSCGGVGSNSESNSGVGELGVNLSTSKMTDHVVLDNELFGSRASKILKPFCIYGI